MIWAGDIDHQLSTFDQHDNILAEVTYTSSIPGIESTECRVLSDVL